jgi:hypothetical protein
MLTLQKNFTNTNVITLIETTLFSRDFNTTFNINHNLPDCEKQL